MPCIFSAYGPTRSKSWEPIALTTERMLHGTCSKNSYDAYAIKKSKINTSTTSTTSNSNATRKHKDRWKLRQLTPLTQWTCKCTSRPSQPSQFSQQLRPSQPCKGIANTYTQAIVPTATTSTKNKPSFLIRLSAVCSSANQQSGNSGFGFIYFLVSCTIYHHHRQCGYCHLSFIFILILQTANAT